MAVVRPFSCVRPAAEHAAEIAALPYDVYNREEAKREVKSHPLSFLAIDRPETGFPDTADMYAPEVYAHAKDLFEQWVKNGNYVEDPNETYYLYELTMNDHSQTGIVACSSVDDYVNGVIKKHENTREEKELDRIRHIDVMDAQSGPIFLAYRPVKRLKELVALAKEENPLYNFISEDGIRHRVWKIGSGDMIKEIREEFEKLPATYIADGHHRAASAVKVALKRRAEHPDAPKDASFNYFLSVLFSEDELTILPYNRVVWDLNGHSEEGLLKEASKLFEVSGPLKEAVEPKERGEVGMYLGGTWYDLKLKAGVRPDDPVKGLDVSVLQEKFLAPVLGIGDPRTDKRIDFVGGIRGVKELERRCEADMKIAFSMYPTSMEELLSVADAGLLMPPKSTWFEPKLRSGIFIHRL